MKRANSLLILILAGLALLYGCTSEKGAGEDLAADSVTLITSIGGSGDNGYNDLVLAGAMRFYQRNSDVHFSLRKPGDLAEARAILDAWLKDTSARTGRSLLILASDDYLPLLEGREPKLNERQRILLFECPEGHRAAGVSTFRICRYGASWLSGAVAAESPEAHIVAANHAAGLMEDAVAGFRDAYSEVAGKTAEIHYLAEDETGFNMPNKAYDLVKDIREAFIFPLAGGSNSGIYKYSREEEFSLQLVAGMDVDCSEYSTRVPFSLVIHIDNVIYGLLSVWLSSGEIPAHSDYTLSDSEAVELLANPLFFERAEAFVEYYAGEDYWQKRIDSFFETAKKRELEYYGK